MSRWVDADAVKEALKRNTPRYMWGEVLATVNVQPHIDIVRCEECKWYDETAMSNVRCRCVDKGKHMKGLVENYADDFCSYGQRKESE